MQDFLGIAVVGAIVSIIMEQVQAKYGTGKLASRVAVIVLSLVFGGFYWFFNDTAFYQSVLGVLATASTVYAFYYSDKVSRPNLEDK